MRIRLIIAALLLAVFGALWMLPRGGRADSFTYSSLRKQVRVAIVVSSALNVDTPNGRQPENPDPHVFYVLDAHTDLKPSGMEFVNPLAPPTVTPDIYKRWRDRIRIPNSDPAFNPNSPSGSVFNVGTRITKNMGAYWEINLDSVSADQLQQFDLLMIHSHKADIAFTPEEREKLRKFVEQGGTLWVENCGAMNFNPYTQFLFDVQMNSGKNDNARAVTGATNHALLTVPYVLTPEEISRLGDKWRILPSPPFPPGQITIDDYYLYAITDPTQGAPGPNDANPPGEQTLSPIVWNTRGLGPANVGGALAPAPGWRPYILAGPVGAGRIVYSAQGSANAINDYVGGANVGYGGNSGAISGQNLLAAHPQDLKFAYNLASWATAHATANSDVRRTNATNDRLSPVLGELWTVNTPAPNTSDHTGGAVFYKSAVFAVDSRLVLHCYDANPERDLDGDGNTDDGLLDYISGTPYDEIWNFDLKQVDGNAQGASTPTVIEFYDPTFVARKGPTSTTAGGLSVVNFNQRELVVVELSDGTVVAVRAFPRAVSPKNNLPLAPQTVMDWIVPASQLGTADPGIANFANLTVPPVAWSEGVLFASVSHTQQGGRIIAIDPQDGGSATNPATTQPKITPNGISVAPAAGPFPPLIGAPSVGYIRDTGTGANDKMIYVQAMQQQGGTTRPQSVVGFWFGTKGEPLTRVAPTAFGSRSPIQWYGTVGGSVTPATWNPILRPRVFWHYHDPASGAIYDRELDYTTTNPPGPNQFAVTWDTPARAVRVFITGANPPPPQGGNTYAADDPNATFFADYTLDWAQPDPTKGQISARATFIAPDTGNGSAEVGGSPALSADDLLLYGVDLKQTTAAAAGRGALFAVNEQFGQVIRLSQNQPNVPPQNQNVIATRLKWAYTMHDGYILPYGNGQTLTVPPRLRQLDEIVARDTNTQPGEYLFNVGFHGTPAYKDGVVYAVADATIGRFDDPGAAPPNRKVSVLCAFKANPTVDLRLFQSNDNKGPLPQDARVVIWQMNVVAPQGGLGVGIGNPGAGTRTNLQPTQFDLDRQSAIVHITSMSAPGGVARDFTSTSMPFVVQVIGTAGASPETPIYGTQVDTWRDINNNNALVSDPRIVGPEGVDNLLWYVVIPGVTQSASPIPSMGHITSSPSVQGNVIWLGMQGGYIASLDLDPGASEPEFQAKGTQARLFTLPSAGTPSKALHLRWTQALFDPFTLPNGGPPVLSPPVGVANVMVANTPLSLRAFQDSFTIIADNKRLVEVNAAGEATWTSDSSRTHGVAGGDLPQYAQDPNGNIVPGNPQNATGVNVVHNVPYSRPSVARRINSNDLLVVDTGNNRVAQIDRGSNVVWEVHRFFDDYKHLTRPGDPLTLNEPADCSYWTDFDPNLTLSAVVDGVTYTYQGPAAIVHYLIADTGNYRVIELVDVYNNAGRPVVLSNGGNPAPFRMLRQLNFVSSSYGLQNKKLRYRTVQRLLVRNGDMPQEWQDPNKQPNDPIRLTLSAVSNYRQVGDPNVARQAVNTGGDTVETGGGSLVLLNEQGIPLSVVSGLRIPDATQPSGFRIQPIVNPTWYSVFQEVVPVNGQPTLYNKYLLADANGCYQITTGTDPRFLNVEWMISADDYFWMTGKRLQASSVRRLSSAVTDPNTPGFGLHHYLITNKSSGSDNPASFGITYNTNLNNPAAGNISGPGEFHGEVFEVAPVTFDLSKPFHGYVRDYSIDNNFANFLVPNDGSGGRPKASIVWRTPSENVPYLPHLGPYDSRTEIPRPLVRRIGDPSRGTSTSLLEQPAFADRPF